MQKTPVLGAIGQKIYYTASVTLFDSGNLFLWLPAATLSHYALERYLKAALICQGMVISDPRKAASLDPALGVTKADCVWDHKLVTLADLLSTKRKEFNLDNSLRLPDHLFIGMSEAEPTAPPDSPNNSALEMPKTLRSGFELFDPFFSELRYPEELIQVKEIGQEFKVSA